jgi:hypothetical protein
MKKLLLLSALIAPLLLAACGGADDGPAAAVLPATAGETSPSALEPASANELPSPLVSETALDAAPSAVAATPAASDAAPGALTSLSTGYDDALSLEGQLAIGALRLEETALAVTETQAAALLPLWQAYQSLSSSGTAAPVELEAVLAQIARTMTGDQVAAIAGMQLTNQHVADLAAEGLLGVGRGAGQGQGAATGQGPGGGIPGAGGGMGRGFGGEPGMTGLDANALATRQAERESGAFMGQALTMAVIRLLQTKTGEAPASGLVAETVVSVIAAATGLETAAVQEQLAAGTPAVAIVEAAGADPAAVRLALETALSQLDNAADLDIPAIVDRWLDP